MRHWFFLSILLLIYVLISLGWSNVLMPIFSAATALVGQPKNVSAAAKPTSIAWINQDVNFHSQRAKLNGSCLRSHWSFGIGLSRNRKLNLYVGLLAFDHFTDLLQAQIEGLESCPFCSYAVVIENEHERLFRCENARCGVVSCRECKKEVSELDVFQTHAYLFNRIISRNRVKVCLHLSKLHRSELSQIEMEEDKVLDGRHAVEEAMSTLCLSVLPFWLNFALQQKRS